MKTCRSNRLRLAAFSILAVFCACSTPRTASHTVSIELTLAETDSSEGYREVFGERSPERLFIREDVLLGTPDIESVSVTERMEQPAVEIIFTEQGTQKLAEITAAHIGKRLAILIDGRLVMAPHIMEAITDGRAVVSGLTKEEAQRIAEGF